jgi:DNA ligase 1
MVTSNEIYEAIQEIASKSGKKDKVARLSALMASDPMAIRVMQYAYNPFITFGIGEKSLAESPVTFGATGLFNEDTFAILDELASRKLTGGAAVASVYNEMTRLSLNSAWLFKHILLKDLRAGFTDGSINDARSGTIPTFNCMLAHPFKDFASKVIYPVWVEPKLDGVRVLAFVNHHDVKFFSRSGKEFTTFDHLKGTLLRMIDEHVLSTPGTSQQTFVLDGEMVSGSFNKTVGDVRRKSEQATDAKFHVFEFMTAAEFNNPLSRNEVNAGSYEVRRKALQDLLGHLPKGSTDVQMLPNWQCKNEAQVFAIYEQLRERGLEGVIVKDPKASYFKKRSPAWLKIKADESIDVKIVTAIEGTGKYEGALGALVIDHNDVLVNVGTGFDDAQRAEFWSCFKSDLNKIGSTEVKDLIGRTIEVGYHEVTPDGSLRHPRFMRFRDDKVSHD